MLQSLYIKDFILIQKLELDFSKGFSVITGNTGSGKSILLKSILFCFGKNFSGNPVRLGAETCSVSCVFRSNGQINTFLDDQGIEYDEQIIVKRTQNKQARKKFFVNDQLVSVKILQKLFSLLLEMHGQHNHTLLLNSSYHTQILDQYGNLKTLQNEVAQKYKKWQEAQKKAYDLDRDRSKLEEEIEYLRHICLELNEADIKIGEEQNLAEIKKKLQNRDNELKIFNNIITEINDSCFAQIVNRAQKMLSKVNSNINLTQQASDDLEAAYDKIEDAKSLLNQAIRYYDLEEYSLEEIDDRLYQIRDLARKHNVLSDELLNFLEESQKRLEFLEMNIKTNVELKELIKTFREDYFFNAKLLSEQRHKTAIDLEKKTMLELAFLEMKKATFKVEIKTNDEYVSINGIDEIKFTASTNPGIEHMPIEKIASGGELSRFMLALRVALLDSAPKNTIIFDEIDVGISGFVADAIGQRLSALSKKIQIIVITHQPQVAGKASSHILVEKTQNKNYTYVMAKFLQDEEKYLELARMISGKTITQASIDAAKELII